MVELHNDGDAASALDFAVVVMTTGGLWEALSRPVEIVRLHVTDARLD